MRHLVRRKLPEWRRKGASEQVQSWVRAGARIQWQSRKRPAKFDLGVSCAAKDLTPAQQTFLDAEVLRCVHEVGSWEPATCRDFVSKAFLVPKPGVPGKWRLVVDLRPLNKFCRKFKMRSETLANLVQLARKDDWMVTLDLKDGYNAVGIHPEDRHYMTFDIQGQLFRCAAVPFGWSQSAYVFCETVRVWITWMRAPLLVDTPEGAEAAGAASVPARVAERGRADRLRWADLDEGSQRLRSTVLKPRSAFRSRGIRLLWYVDDLMLLAPTREKALEVRAFAEQTLEALGLQRQPTKGMWEPAQVTTHLGLEVDTREGRFRLTDSRRLKLRRLASGLGAVAAKERRWVRVKDLAGLVGLAQSAYLAIPPARFYLRELHNCIATRSSWAGRVKLTKQALRDLAWWRDVPQRWSERRIWRAADSAYLHCDASGNVGWGGVLNGLTPARGFWRETQKALHITLKELKAVRFTVETFVNDLNGKRVLLWEDNQGVVAILTNVTSRSPALMAELRKLWWLLDTNDITLRARYIRSAANVWADKLSRDRDGHGDWMLHPELFRQLDLEWGKHTVDRFATANNAQLARFNSLMAGPQCEAVDSMAQTDEAWRAEVNWCNPPWGLLARVAAKLRSSKAAATVVAPTWRSAPWYQDLLELCSEVRVEPARHDLFLPGDRGSRTAVGSPGWSITVFRIPGTRRL
jgi:mRNA-degrading endonuclease HigB of HigAB toxin-antitoxin module